jgi:hypothetical protein
MISALLLTLIPLKHVDAALTARFASLNATLGGRLGETRPISEPCYADSTSDACTYIQENYVNSTFRGDVYGATMYVSNLLFFSCRVHMLTSVLSLSGKRVLQPTKVAFSTTRILQTPRLGRLKIVR